MRKVILAAVLMAATAGTAGAQTNDPVEAHGALSALIEKCSLTGGQYQALGVLLDGLEALMTRDQIAEVRERQGKNNLYFPDRLYMGDPFNTEKVCEKAAEFAGIDGIE